MIVHFAIKNGTKRSFCRKMTMTQKQKLNGMRKILKAGLLLSLAAVLLGYGRINAQIAEVGKIMAAGAADAELLLQPYITPAVNAFGAAMGSGWYNTAETHKLGGFDITLSSSVAIIPKKYETFVIDDSELSFLKLNNPAMTEAPTVAGAKENGPQMDYNYSEFSETAFMMPRGLNTNYVPSPMLQAGIGLIKGTEVLVRYMPNIKYKGNEIGLWGIGGKHDLGQWIPGLKKLPVLKIAVMYGYTKLHTFVDIDLTPDNINAGTLPGADANPWDNQYMKLIVQSQTANILFSANLPVVCFYGGLGFVSTKTNLKLEGDYPSVYIDGTTPTVQSWVDPIDMEIRNQDGGVTKPRVNAGIRFKLAVITIHFDYSWANYSVLTAGLGVSIR